MHDSVSEHSLSIPTLASPRGFQRQRESVYLYIVPIRVLGPLFLATLNNTHDLLTVLIRHIWPVGSTLESTMVPAQIIGHLCEERIRGHATLDLLIE